MPISTMLNILERYTSAESQIATKSISMECNMITCAKTKWASWLFIDIFQTIHCSSFLVPNTTYIYIYIYIYK